MILKWVHSFEKNEEKNVYEIKTTLGLQWVWMSWGAVGLCLRDRNSAFSDCGQAQAHGWGQKQVVVHLIFLYSYTLIFFWNRDQLSPTTALPLLSKGHSGSQPELCLSRFMTLAELPDFSGLPPSSWAKWIGPSPVLQGWAVSMGHSRAGLQWLSQSEWRTKRTLNSWGGTVRSLSPVSQFTVLKNRAPHSRLWGLLLK